MPTYQIATGLPNYPTALSDGDAALVLPLYRGMSSLARRVSEVTNSVQYDAAEQLGLSPFVRSPENAVSQITVLASTALPYGAMLSLTEVGGRIYANLADNSIAGRRALAVCNQPGGIAAGTAGPAVFIIGRTAGIENATFGATYWLGTAGQVVNAAPTATIVQKVGVGLGSYGFQLRIDI